MSSRPDTTIALRRASTMYLAKRNYSVHAEVGLVQHGRLKADLWAFNTKLEICLIEIKSCWQDYATDKKWVKYTQFAHKAYMCVTHSMYSNHPELASALRDQGWGLLVLGLDGYVTCVLNAKSHDCGMTNIKPIVVKLAFRHGSHRHNTRRTKVAV